MRSPGEPDGQALPGAYPGRTAVFPLPIERLRSLPLTGLLGLWLAVVEAHKDYYQYGIREGQGWDLAGEEARRVWKDRMETVAGRWVSRLRDHPAQTGCLSLRHCREIDCTRGAPLEKQSQLAFLLSLGHVERAATVVLDALAAPARRLRSAPAALSAANPSSTRGSIDLYDIVHRVGIHATPAAVSCALATREGPSAWWTSTTSGAAGAGGVLQFRLGPRGGFDLHLETCVPGERVTWRVIAGPEAWLDTRIDWQLVPRGEWTIVLFAHRGWREQGDFMHHCSTKWAVLIVGMKALLEGGEAAPWPRDVPLDDAEAAAAAA